MLTRDSRTVLDVVTPLPIDDYRRDFTSQADADEFHALLARAATVVQLPPVGSRPAAYRRAGVYVVDHSELIFAIWNGSRAAGEGGTADIVGHAARKGRVVIWIDAEHPDADSKLAQAARDGAISPQPFPASAAHLSRGYAQQRGFLADPTVNLADIRRTLTDETDVLLASGASQPLLFHFVRADLMARSFQHRHIRSVQSVVGLAGVAVSAAIGRGARHLVVEPSAALAPQVAPRPLFC
jgi:hypothetical protein